MISNHQMATSVVFRPSLSCNLLCVLCGACAMTNVFRFIKFELITHKPIVRVFTSLSKLELHAQKEPHRMRHLTSHEDELGILQTFRDSSLRLNSLQTNLVMEFDSARHFPSLFRTPGVRPSPRWRRGSRLARSAPTFLGNVRRALRPWLKISAASKFLPAYSECALSARQYSSHFAPPGEQEREEEAVRAGRGGRWWRRGKTEA